MFRCPHCRNALLTCKNIVMPFTEQHRLFEQALGEDWNLLVVGCKDEMAWAFSGQDFATLSVTPSLDASASDHWHGCITNGEVS